MSWQLGIMIQGQFGTNSSSPNLPGPYIGRFSFSLFLFHSSILSSSTALLWNTLWEWKHWIKHSTFPLTFFPEATLKTDYLIGATRYGKDTYFNFKNVILPTCLCFTIYILNYVCLSFPIHTSKMFFFETGLMAMNSRSSCISLPTARIKSMCQHAWQIFLFF
jgi:hypothetical protein